MKHLLISIIDPETPEEAENNFMKSTKLHRFLVLIITLFTTSLFTGGTAFGQAVSARLVGTVQDATKSRIASASVTVQDTETGLKTDTTTNAQGRVHPS